MVIEDKKEYINKLFDDINLSFTELNYVKCSDCSFINASFQESILKFYDFVKLDKFNVKFTIDAFVLTIARNKIIDILRKNKIRI